MVKDLCRKDAVSFQKIFTAHSSFLPLLTPANCCFSVANFTNDHYEVTIHNHIPNSPMNTTHFLHAEQCCLFIVDPQERLMAQIHQAERVSQRIQLMLHLAKALEIPVRACTQYAKGIGPIVPEIAALLTDVPCVDKTQFNALAHPEVQQMLQRLPKTVDTLLLCGVESHICIYQSAKAALQANYQVQVVADGISSRSPENDAYGKQRLRDMGAIVAPAEMIVYEVLQKAGTPAFKAMLPHVK